MKKTCVACGGTGQIGYFQGVSRFLLSWQECPQCNGTGYCLVEKHDRPEDEKNSPAQSGNASGKQKKTD